VDRQVVTDLNELYIEPITRCNLRCRLCYSRPTYGRDDRMAGKGDVVGFVKKFADYVNDAFTVYWCGTGEIFLHPDFPSMVDALSAAHPVSHKVMTNGTINRLDEFVYLKDVSFLVSIDGPKRHHEWNRGGGTYDRSVKFCKAAHDAGCEVTVRCLVTAKNVDELAEFRQDLQRRVGSRVRLILEVPFSNRDIEGVSGSAFVGRVHDDSSFLPPDRLRDRVLGRYGEDFAADSVLTVPPTKKVQVSLLLTDVYSCCHGITKIGDVGDPMKTIVERLSASKAKCGSCPMLPVC